MILILLLAFVLNFLSSQLLYQSLIKFSSLIYVVVTDTVPTAVVPANPRA